MKNFVEFWPFYVREHNSPLNRRLHFIGTLLAMMSLGWGLATMNPLCFLLTPVFGYSFAWIGHFGVQGNKPATFKHPLWSLIADFKMFGLMATGKMDDEVKKFG